MLVSDGTDNAQTNFPFEVDPLIPVVTGVTPSGAVGLPLGEVEFEAEIDGAYDTVTWDFGAGAEILNQTGNTALVRLQDPANYTGSVFAENTNGSGDPLEFGYQVAAPERPQWSIMALGPAIDPFRAGSYVNRAPAVLLVNDKPVVFYNGIQGVRMARALVENPTGPNDWVESIVVPSASITNPHAVVERDGVYYLLFTVRVGAFHSGLWFARSTTLEPQGPEDWVTYELGSYGGSVLVSLAAHPAGLAFGGVTLLTDPDRQGVLFGWIESPETSTELADWTVHTIGLPGQDENTQGVLQVSFIGDTVYMLLEGGFPSPPAYVLEVGRSTVFPPSRAEDWVFSEAGLGSQSVDVLASLAFFGGQVLVFHAQAPFGDGARVKISDGLETGPSTTWADVGFERDNWLSYGGPVVIASNRLVTGVGSPPQVVRMVTAHLSVDHFALGWDSMVVDSSSVTDAATIGTLADEGLLLAY
ncbi:MAG TPA: hypothetical protein VEI97_15515, partial [bacterium]|nr:hypothetical protein [bacterium]